MNFYAIKIIIHKKMYSYYLQIKMFKSYTNIIYKI